MAGASDRTRRVTALNGNWEAGVDGRPGKFELLVVTEDEERYSVSTSPEAVTALMSMARPGTVLLWDPEPRTLIVANIVGEWLPQDWTSLTGPP